MSEQTVTGYVRPRRGKLEAVIQVDGRKVRKATGYALGQEAEAQRFLEVLLGELRSAVPAQPSGAMTVREWGERWLKDRRARGLVSAEDEEAQLEHHIYPQLGDRPLAALTKVEILAWVRGLPRRQNVRTGEPISPRYVHHVAGTFRRLMAEAVDVDLVPSNPCTWRAKRDLPPRRDTDSARRRLGGLEPWEAWELVHSPKLPEDRRVYYALALYTGHRPGDLAPRRWRDLEAADPADGHPWEPLPLLNVKTAWNTRVRREKDTKTHTEKPTPVHPELGRILDAWRSEGWAAYTGRAPQPDDLLVPAERGGMRNVGYVNALFKADVAALGLRPGRTLYSCRATFYSAAQAGGASKADVMLITHPSPSEASDYYRRLNVLWPVLCRTVLAVTYAPRPPEAPVLEGHSEVARARAQHENPRNSDENCGGEVVTPTGLEPG